jgi:hypothetical protein
VTAKTMMTDNFHYKIVELEQPSLEFSEALCVAVPLVDIASSSR